MVFESRGWILYKREKILGDGRKGTEYFLSKHVPTSGGTPCDMPRGFKLGINELTGLPCLVPEGGPISIKQPNLVPDGFLTKNCIKCGAKNSRDGVFCGECGEKFEETTIEKHCPNCHLWNKSKNKFCEKCGTVLGG